MSIDTDAILAYGYDCGEDFFTGWGAEPPWKTPFDASYRDAAARALMNATGLRIQPGDYFDPGDLKRVCGVELIHHGYDGSPSYILAAASQTAYRGDPQVADFSIPEGADEKLAWAVEVLGFTPKLRGPRWLLASWWSN